MKTMNSPSSRRHFLGRLGAFGAATTAAPWLANLAALSSAQAATTTGYRALVCLFQYGGNDAYNTVLATDATSWNNYNAVRSGDPDPVSLPPVGTVANKKAATFNARLGGVLPIAPANTQGRAFALHPSLAAVRDLFAAGRVAIVSNVGPLVKPTTKSDYVAGTAQLPSKLFSHNDQQSNWQSMGPEGTTVGWGGTMMDRCLVANTNQIFSSVCMNGNAVWLDGAQARPYQLGLSGAIKLGSTTGLLYGSASAQAALQSIMRTTREDVAIETDHAAVVGRSIDAEGILTPALPPANTAPWGTPGLAAGAVDPLLTYIAPSTGKAAINPITAQLQPIARMIAARATLGMSRQVFFVGIDGWDTHAAQPAAHADLMAQLAQAMSYWDTVTRAMGVDQSVTTFTASDFGRAFPSNGGGTDHGWGGHHFVMGGAVKGGDLYGRFPVYGAADGVGGFLSNDQVGDGAMLPATSVEQYAATLGKWFGLSDSELLSTMPNLANWPVASRNLGFLA
jgi:uncharacterized protein (DUF1501 family)